GRCYFRLDANADLVAIQWDEGAPWEFWLKFGFDAGQNQYRIEGEFRRGTEQMPITKPTLLGKDGILFHDGWAARFNHFGAYAWIVLLAKTGVITIPARQKDEFLNELFGVPVLPRIEMPEDLRFEEVHAAPKPRLKISKGKNSYNDRLNGELTFDYDGAILAA